MVRNPSSALNTSAPKPRRNTEAPFPTPRRRGSHSPIRGAQNRSIAVRRPLRIPGR
ncbi:hypothetical protein [Nocardia lasii]|uniref:Uncharacterized protein n=1 Tax=Nocardia lasii TaxID=1616107 RepID=A0ABW1JZE8_9NOCA